MDKNIFGHRFDGTDNGALSDTFSNVDGSAALGLNDPLVQDFSSAPHNLTLPLTPHEPLSNTTITSSGFPAVIHVSSLDGTNGFAITGISNGFSVNSAGDINGDGFSDIILGSSDAAVVVFGHAGSFSADIDLSSLNGSNGFEIVGAAELDELGSSVASAGDINGDGFADFIVGAPDTRGPDEAVTGAAYVVFGHGGKFPVDFDVSQLDGRNGFEIFGASSYDEIGGPVTSAGDINGDGFADVAVGARQASLNGTSSGAVYVVFGHDGKFDASLDLSALNGQNGFVVSGGEAFSEIGSSVASAGDINGDGFADMIIGAPFAGGGYSPTGQAYVVFGHAGKFQANIDVSLLNGTNGFEITGVESRERAGWSVASAGDVNGDGFADIIIGAPYATFDRQTNGTIAGEGYIVFGHSGGFGADLDLSTLNGTNGFSIGALGPFDRLGFSVASAGDVNGDGFADFIVSTPFGSKHPGSYDGVYSGVSYVVFGHSGHFSANFDLSTLDGTNGFKIVGAANSDRAGYSVASAGDVNGDGFDDLIVGNPHRDASYVIFGQAPTEAVTRVGSIASQAISGGAFDDTLSGLGGNDTLHGNDGNDHLIGGAGADVLDGGKGADTMEGGLGSDTYIVNNTHDVVIEAANAGTDTVQTNLTSYTLGDNVEHLVYTGIQAFTGTGNSLANVITGGDFDDTLSGLRGDDTLTGGNGDDVLIGGAGADRLNGGGGADTFRYATVAESSSTHHDTIVNLNFAQDHFDLPVSVTGISAAVVSGSLSAASFDTDLAADIGKAQLGRHHAVLFTASAGDLAGHTFLIVDANGRTGYQAGHDYVFDITGAHNTAHLSTATFI